jgi:hypothetical protein
MAKNTYRTTGHDVRHPVVNKPKFKPNDPPANRIGIYNAKGQRVAHIGPHGGASVVSKLLGGAPAEIGKVKGKPAWISSGPSQTSAVTRAATQLRKQIRTDRGSAKKR